MALTFLSLPRELRLMIYRHALTSSTGLVIYKRNLHSIRTHYGPDSTFTLYAASPPHSHTYDPLPHEPMNVALLQVCKEIFLETRFLLWTLNVLVFSSQDLPKLEVQKRVQHVLLQNYRLDEDDRRGPTPLFKTIEILSRWAEEGVLKSITIRTREPLRHPYDSQQYVERIISGHLERWRAATSPSQPLSNVFKMVIFTGINLLALKGGCKPIVKFEEIQKELHDAMNRKGEIWVEGELGWRDGEWVGVVGNGEGNWGSAFEWVGGMGAGKPRVRKKIWVEIKRLEAEEEEGYFGAGGRGGM